MRHPALHRDRLAQPVFLPGARRWGAGGGRRNFRPRRPTLMPLWGGPDGAPPMLAPGGIARAGPRLPPNTGRLAGTRAAPACHGVVRDGALTESILLTFS